MMDHTIMKVEMVLLNARRYKKLGNLLNLQWHCKHNRYKRLPFKFLLLEVSCNLLSIKYLLLFSATAAVAMTSKSRCVQQRKVSSLLTHLE